MYLQMGDLISVHTHLYTRRRCPKLESDLFASWVLRDFNRVNFEHDPIIFFATQTNDDRS